MYHNQSLLDYIKRNNKFITVYKKIKIEYSYGLHDFCVKPLFRVGYEYDFNKLYIPKGRLNNKKITSGCFHYHYGNNSLKNLRYYDGTLLIKQRINTKHLIRAGTPYEGFSNKPYKYVLQYDPPIHVGIDYFRVTYRQICEAILRKKCNTNLNNLERKFYERYA